MTFSRSLSLWAGLVLACFPVFAQQNPPTPPVSAGKQAGATQSAAPKKADHAASYYHYSLAHMYEEMAAMYGRSEYVNKAIEEYRLAIDNDPSSEFLNAGLAELYARTGRIRDAVTEAQDIVKRDPNNLVARKLLGRIYLRSLGDMQTGTQSAEVLKLAVEQYEAIVKLEPRNPDNHLLLGRLYSLSKDFLKAEDEFKTVIKLEPNSEEALTSLAVLYNEEGDSKKAVETLNAVPEAGRSAKLYAALGYTYEHQKDYKNAISAYRQAVALDHDNLDAMRALAKNLVNDDQIEAALEEYLTVEEADPQDAETAMHISELYSRLGKFDAALENLKKAEAVIPDSLEIPFKEAAILDLQGKYDEAVDTLQKVLTRTARADGAYNAGDRSNRTAFLEKLGSIYYEQNKVQLALETYKKILVLDNDEAPRAYQFMIEIYRDQKQWAEATRVAKEAAAKFPQEKGIKLALANQLADEGKADESVQLAKSLLKGTAEDRDTYVMMSQLYSRLKRWPDAEDAIIQAGKLSSRPDEKIDMQFALGSIYERQKKYDQAEQTFRQVLQQEPNHSRTLNYLGYMLADHNSHLEEALALIKKALVIEPQNGAYLESLGWAYFKLGNFDQAEENLRKAADKTPNDATIQDHLGELYARTGRLKMAAAHWERAVDEWNKSLPGEFDQQDLARVQKKLESTKIKLAQQTRN
jgi:tetratricopeptide (TPR) repeat protein